MAFLRHSRGGLGRKMKILVWQVDFWGIHIENFLDPKTLNQNMFGKWSNMAHEEKYFHEKKLHLILSF